MDYKEFENKCEGNFCPRFIRKTESCNTLSKRKKCFKKFVKGIQVFREKIVLKIQRDFEQRQEKNLWLWSNF